jgi:hypothetical protein
MYRGLRKSIIAVAFVIGAAALAGFATQNGTDLPVT